MSKQMRVGVQYWNQEGTSMYVTKSTKDGAIYATSKPKRLRPFGWGKASAIHSQLIKDGKKARLVYE